MKNIEAPEHDIQSSIITYLNYSGYYVWRENVGTAERKNKDGSKRMVRFGKAGISDIIGIRKHDGKFIALEVKRPSRRNYVTPQQESFLAMIADFNGIGGVVTGIDDVEKLLKK
jgi:hypothetical protein